MRKTMIECSGLHKTFTQTIVPMKRLQDHVLQAGRKKERMRIDAVQNVSFHLEEGEWVGIYGPNGSGKSTFMRLLAGLLVPDAGSIKRGGRISNFELGIGFHPERNAEENIYLHGLLQGMSPKEIREAMDRTLEFADIGKHAALPMKCLSTGMAMRLSFAAVAQVNADVYLFDEVLAVGDEKFQLRCVDYLKDLRKNRKSAVMVSHSLDGLFELVDRVVFFENGQVTGERTAAEHAEERRRKAALHA